MADPLFLIVGLRDPVGFQELCKRALDSATAGRQSHGPRGFMRTLWCAASLAVYEPAKEALKWKKRL